MLRAIDADTLQQAVAFCDDSFFGAQIAAALLTYGTDERYLRCWYEGEAGHCTAVVALTEANATLVAAETADFTAIAALLRVAGAKGVLGEEACIRALPLPLGGRGSMMRAERLQNIPAAEVRRVDAEQLAALYDVLHGTGAAANNPRSFMAWLPDISHRVRHGSASFYAVYAGEEPVSCAGVLYANRTMGCIGGVATKPAFRNRGFASAATAAAANAILLAGKIPYLARNGDKTKMMYRSLGFYDCGTWARADV